MQKIDAGNAAIFNCSVTGAPVGHVAWFKDGVKVKANDSRLHVTEPGRLVVHDVRRSDQGMYQCFASNAHQSEQGAAQLSLGGNIRTKIFRNSLHTGRG